MLDLTATSAHAKPDGQPVLAITGHTFHDLIGTRQQQDVDLERVFEDAAVYTERVIGPAHLCNVLDEAVRRALAQRGAAHINLPKDTLTLAADRDYPSEHNTRAHTQAQFENARPLPPDSDLQHAADI